MSEEPLPDSEEKALSWIVHGAVSWLLDDRHALEVLPEGVGRVGEAPMGKGIRHEQVAELVVNTRCGNGLDGQDGEACAKSYEEYRQHSEMAASSKTRKSAFSAGEPFIAQTRAADCEDCDDYGETKFDQQQHAE